MVSVRDNVLSPTETRYPMTGFSTSEEKGREENKGEREELRGEERDAVNKI